MVWAVEGQPTSFWKIPSTKSETRNKPQIQSPKRAGLCRGLFEI